MASLDPATADQVLVQLHQICKEDGISAVVSLHQVDLAKRYADRIVGLAHGRVVFDATPEELTPSHVSDLYEQKNSIMAPGTIAIPLNIQLVSA